MKRKVLETLKKWYDAKEQNIIYLYGAKGVGKTRLVYDFLNDCNAKKAYLNFELTENLKQLLDGETMEEIVSSIATYFEFHRNEEVIFVFDECYFVENKISTIVEQAKFLTNAKIILISSYNIERLENYPTDVLPILQVYPLDFEEFLEVGSNKWYINVIREHFASCKPIPEIVHQELLSLFYDYILIGGMPAAVNEYYMMDSILNLGEQHILLLNHQRKSLSTIVEESTYGKAMAMLDTIDMQLAKKNHNFQYSIIRKGATKNQYHYAKKVLVSNHVMLEATSLDKKHHKLFLYDTGILSTKTKQRKFDIEHAINPILWKGLLENYVAQTLVSLGYPLEYWESEASAKIDFIIQKKSGYLTAEVYCDENTKSKAVSIFKENHSCIGSYKISSKNFYRKNRVQYVPYYAVFCM